MVEVFKTNLCDTIAAFDVLHRLRGVFPDAKITFDLEDHDRIMRFEHYEIDTRAIASLIEDLGFYCEILPEK
ncbi:hypothetical protein GC194_08340 [bacterium]|nr:hypothetical protein [bacterium]